jgi:hypothetical protein
MTRDLLQWTWPLSYSYQFRLRSCHLKKKTNQIFQKLCQVTDQHWKTGANVLRSESFTITSLIRSSFPRQGKQNFISSKVAISPPDTPLQTWTGLLGLLEVAAPRISRQSAHEGGKVVSYMLRPSSPPQRYSQGIKWMKNPNDSIGNRTRYLPDCSAVLEPTAPPVPALWVPRVKLPARESVCVEVRNEWSYASTPPHTFMTWTRTILTLCLIEFYNTTADVTEQDTVFKTGHINYGICNPKLRCCLTSSTYSSVPELTTTFSSIF